MRSPGPALWVLMVGCSWGVRPEPPLADEVSAAAAPVLVAEADDDADSDDSDEGGEGVVGRTDERVGLPGKWRPSRRLPELTDEQRALMEQLEAIGYADGTMEVLSEVTVTVHDEARAQPGLNLFTSGHAAEAWLVGMDASVRHRWAATFLQAFPEATPGPNAVGVNHWRRARVGPQGELYAIFEGRGVVKLDRDSKVLWARPNGAHHDLALVEGGTRLMLLTRESKMLPDVSPDRPVLEDAVTLLDAQTGEKVWSFSLLQALLDSPFADRVSDRKLAKGGDLFHTNTLVVLDDTLASTDPAFQPGRLLVSLRNLSLLGVVDPEARRFVWVGSGEFKRQHDPKPLSDGRLALFDNAGIKGKARALIVSVPSMKTVWQWRGADGKGLRSPTLGAVQPLANGNLLVTESEGGRAVEVAPDGSVVWEFYNPHRAGDGGRFIAALFELVRVPEASVAGWLR